MSESEPPAFDRVGNEFLGYYDTVRGYVREQVTRLNLEPFLTAEPMNVADIGGGDGRDARWLAAQGHNVTIVDPSILMLEKAGMLSRDAGLDDKIKTLKGDARSLLDAGGSGFYDLVLSHGVLMYDLDDPEGHLKNLVNLAGRGGIVSILTKGFIGTISRLVDQYKLVEVESVIRTHKVENNLKEMTWAFDEGQLNSAIQRAGAEILAKAGIRIVTDRHYESISDFQKDELRKIISIEYQLGKRASTWGLGQMLHFIARKNRT